MLRRRRFMLATAFALTVANSTYGAINGEVSINGGANYTALSGSPFTSGAAITVNLGTVSSEVVLRFYESTASDDLGAVTINGSLGTGGRVSMIVANGLSVFPQVAIDAIPDPGVRNVAGVTITDPDLRANTRVAIAGTGSLTGPITVGHVFRLQFNSTGTGAGEIQAAVTATAANNAAVTNTGELDAFGNPIFAEPIAFVRATKKISGALTATDGDIGTVSIGLTTAQTDGLQADIKAPSGRIGSIYCAGVIGNPGGTRGGTSITVSTVNVC